MREQYRCEICGHIEHKWRSMASHVAMRMVTNEQGQQDHPHWRELDVSHHDGEAWKEQQPAITDYSALSSG